ncbi:MAG: hypothetical protein JNM81_09185 [Rhodospirillaceae bacterium]|nr:hypothetical protein [Rhodospirillaceae bacterium]
MTSIELIHFLHVVAFALIIGVELPAFYAAKLAAAERMLPESRLMAARIVKWANGFSSLFIILLLPLGVSLGGNLGVYRISNEVAITITWVVGLVWVALLLLANKDSGLGQKLYGLEIWVRILIGAGNVYDGVNALLGGNSPIQTKWLAVKVLLLGVVMILSALIRKRLRPVRAEIAKINPNSAMTAGWDDRTALAMSDTLKTIRPLVHATLLCVLVAAWMGINKSW